MAAVNIATVSTNGITRRSRSPARPSSPLSRLIGDYTRDILNERRASPPRRSVLNPSRTRDLSPARMEETPARMEEKQAQENDNRSALNEHPLAPNNESHDRRDRHEHDRHEHDRHEHDRHEHDRHEHDRPSAPMGIPLILGHDSPALEDWTKASRSTTSKREFLTWFLLARRQSQEWIAMDPKVQSLILANSSWHLLSPLCDQFAVRAMFQEVINVTRLACDWNRFDHLVNAMESFSMVSGDREMNRLVDDYKKEISNRSAATGSIAGTGHGATPAEATAPAAPVVLSVGASTASTSAAVEPIAA